MEKYEKLFKIKQGRFGVVYKARHRASSNIVAVKYCRNSNDGGLCMSSLREIRIAHELCHPNIVKLYEAIWPTRNDQFLIFEYVTTDLSEHLLAYHGYLPVVKIKSYLYQINSAILYCHNRRILHCDLKPCNILVNDSGIIKVADFGLSRVVTGTDRTCTSRAVTFWYKSPELIIGCKMFSFPIDVWSVGCIFSELYTKIPLFAAWTEAGQLRSIFRILGIPTTVTWPAVATLPYVLQSFLKIFPEGRSQRPNTNLLRLCVPNIDMVGLDLLQRMLVCNPDHRITIRGALQHPYFFDVCLPADLISQYCSVY